MHYLVSKGANAPLLTIQQPIDKRIYLRCIGQQNPFDKEPLAKILSLASSPWQR